MKKQRFSQVLSVLIGTNIGMFLQNGQFVEGILLDVKPDHLIIDVNNNIFYIATHQILAFSKNAKDHRVNSASVPYLDRVYLTDILNSLKYNWVTINGLNNQTFTGLLTTIMEDYIVLINNEEQLFIQRPLISNIFNGIYETKDQHIHIKQEVVQAPPLDDNHELSNRSVPPQEELRDDAAVDQVVGNQGQPLIESDVQESPEAAKEEIVSVFEDSHTEEPVSEFEEAAKEEIVSVFEESHTEEPVFEFGKAAKEDIATVFEESHTEEPVSEFGKAAKEDIATVFEESLTEEPVSISGESPTEELVFEFGADPIAEIETNVIGDFIQETSNGYKQEPIEEDPKEADPSVHTNRLFDASATNVTSDFYEEHIVHKAFHKHHISHISHISSDWLLDTNEEKKKNACVQNSALSDSMWDDNKQKIPAVSPKEKIIKDDPVPPLEMNPEEERKMLRKQYYSLMKHAERMYHQLSDDQC